MSYCKKCDYQLNQCKCDMVDCPSIKKWHEMSKAEKANAVDWWPHQIDKDSARQYSYEITKDGKILSAIGGYLF